LCEVGADARFHAIFGVVAIGSVLAVLSGTSLGHSVATGGLQHGRHLALLVVFPHDL